MVCQQCEKKLNKLACPDTWKDGAGTSKQGGSGGGRALNENKALTKAKRYSPYGANQTKCKVCKSTLHQEGMYCLSCAYKQGLCQMCGKQILDTKPYKQSMK